HVICASSYPLVLFSLFFFPDPPPTEIHPLSLHDALPISSASSATPSSASTASRWTTSPTSSALARRRRRRSRMPWRRCGDGRIDPMKCMHRPARIIAGADELSDEFAAARWTYHRLLDFEDRHQRLLDDVADQCAPGLRRVARLLAVLGRRQRRAERTSPGTWAPRPRPELLATLRARLNELRKQRDADPRWREALLWADGVDSDAPERGKPRRKAGETDEQFAKRCATRRSRLTRREAYRAKLYAERRVYWGTWNALLASVDAARKAVIKQRKAGVAASWKRPRWDDPCTIAADAGGFRIVERGKPWWVVEMRLLEGWVRFRAKLGNWHDLPEGAKLKTCKLTRRKNGRGWEYSVSIAVDGMPDPREQFASRGMVA